MDSAAFVVRGRTAVNFAAGISGKKRDEPARQPRCNHLKYMIFLPKAVAR
jgi:hypothetical protein